MMTRYDCYIITANSNIKWKLNKIDAQRYFIRLSSIHAFALHCTSLYLGFGFVALSDLRGGLSSSSNILLDQKYEARVSDFGTARLVKLDSSNWTELAGTYGYIAPGNMNLTISFEM